MSKPITFNGWRRTWSRWLLAAVLLLTALPAGLWQAQRSGLWPPLRAGTTPHAAGSLTKPQSPEQKLRSASRELKSAKQQLEALRAQIASLQHAQRLDAEICKAVRGSVQQMEGETAQLRQQLAYYKGLSAPQTAGAGVRVQSLTLANHPDGYRYHLVLMQSERADERIAGTAEIQLLARRGDIAVSLPLRSLVHQGDRDWVFSFKYFDEFSGAFRLPEDLTPEKLVVTLKAVNDRPVAKEEFPWVMLANESLAQHD